MKYYSVSYVVYHVYALLHIISVNPILLLRLLIVSKDVQ